MQLINIRFVIVILVEEQVLDDGSLRINTC